MLVSHKVEKPIESAFLIFKERDDANVTTILLKRKPKTNGGMSMNNKLIINTNLLRKESEFKTYTCVVEKAVPVSTEEFERLKHAPMCNNCLISDKLNSMWYGNGIHHPCCGCVWYDRNADILFCPFHNCVRNKKGFEAPEKKVNKNAD